MMNPEVIFEGYEQYQPMPNHNKLRKDRGMKLLQYQALLTHLPLDKMAAIWADDIFKSLFLNDLMPSWPKGGLYCDIGSHMWISHICLQKWSFVWNKTNISVNIVHSFFNVRILLKSIPPLDLHNWTLSYWPGLHNAIEQSNTKFSNIYTLLIAVTNYWFTYRDDKITFSQSMSKLVISLSSMIFLVK